MAEEKQDHQDFFHHHKDEQKPTQVAYSGTTAYPDQYGGVVATESQVDYEKEAKHHKHKEHLGKLGAAAAGAFALDSESSSKSPHQSGLDKTETKGLPFSNESPNQGPHNHVIINMKTIDLKPSTPTDGVRVAVPRKTWKQDRPERGFETVVASAIACILAILGISDYSVSSNGAVTPKFLFHRHPASFYYYLLVSMAACSLSFIGLVFERALPALAKAIHGIASTAVILSITVFLWASLPDELSWLPWVFFLLTLLAIFGLLVYQRAARLRAI